jgi:hypothetical protein
MSRTNLASTTGIHQKVEHWFSKVPYLVCLLQIFILLNNYFLPSLQLFSKKI